MAKKIVNYILLFTWTFLGSTLSVTWFRMHHWMRPHHQMISAVVVP